MVDLNRILRDGGVLSLLASLLLLAILRVNPRLFLQDYPAEIQAAVPPKTEQEERHSLVLGIPFVLLAAVVPFWSTWALQRASGGSLGFLTLTFHGFGVASVFNLVDLVVLDWWLFCTVQPKIMVIPGTEGMGAYRDYGYHFRAFCRGTAICAAAGLAIAALVTWL